jgi:hypothetical protein
MEAVLLPAFSDLLLLVTCLLAVTGLVSLEFRHLSPVNSCLASQRGCRNNVRVGRCTAGVVSLHAVAIGGAFS